MQVLGLRDYDPMAFYAGIPPLRQAIDQVLFRDNNAALPRDSHTI
jgi:hypothetical protein